MAGPVLNLKILTKSTAHSLRAISIITFPSAFIMLLIHGIIANRVNPAITILPLFCSAAYSVLLLANEKKCGCQSSGLTGTPVHLILDTLLGTVLFVCLLLAWIFVPNGNGGQIMLGTYGTNFIAANVLIHSYFVAEQLHAMLQPNAMYPMSCPHCQYGPLSATVRSGLKNGYAPLLDVEGEPGTSTEEGQGV
ncbi:hypothetical protein BDV95DRAFT_496620 [Massariosphaeria phaeospora]|uniref:MARVEL domain-containing protein n=1 Tax=Massariosphaeria phaeospora TaxID=100035 RepID=A0A7C8I3Y9_9PLEO|nr:hypothetical protein BDV95DRAFT_496620 [Massariosphaeria phaeospora]